MVGRRLAALLVGVAAYYIIVGLAIRAYQPRPIEWGAVGSLITTLILGLLMSFRNRAAYQRWWEARGHWQQLVNDSRNLAVKCAAFVPGHVLARSPVAEILKAFPEALAHCLRNEPYRLQDVPGFEHDRPSTSDIPLDLAQRLYATFADWSREGHIDQTTLRILDIHGRGLMDVWGGCEKIRATPLSPSYKALLRTGLVLHVLVAPWLLVPESGLWSLPVVLLIGFFLFGVELIDSVVEEPFGRDRDDLALDQYCRTIRESVEAALSVVTAPRVRARTTEQAG